MFELCRREVAEGGVPARGVIEGLDVIKIMDLAWARVAGSWWWKHSVLRVAQKDSAVALS